MTTILADTKLGVMVSDSNVSDEDRAWSRRKVWRIGGALVGVAGSTEHWLPLLDWLRHDPDAEPPKFGDASLLILDRRGLRIYNCSPFPERAQREAIGCGGKVAMAVYEALGWQDPAKAVRITCKHDAGSRAPVRLYRL